MKGKVRLMGLNQLVFFPLENNLIVLVIVSQLEEIINERHIMSLVHHISSWFFTFFTAQRFSIPVI